jgi:ADP-ribose pyrophosphatase YjhB (NUDIX family)
MTRRETRYQGVILRADHLLLLKHCEHATGRCYWVIPGGGREPGESETACVQREMREETNLQVAVERLLLDEPGRPMGVYRNLKTYLCRETGGEASPGYEPEEEAAREYAITEIGWFDLRDPAGWDPLAVNDAITHPFLLRIREALGYE